MTSCVECLTAMRTTSLAEMGPGSLVASHVATCPRCATVSEELRYAQHRLASALNEQRSSQDASELAIAAIDGSERARRKRIARWLRGGLVVVACGVFFVFMQQRTHPGPTAAQANAVVTRTIVLKCITSDQAMALATPYLRTEAGIWTVPDSRVITLRGQRKEIQRALSEIDKIDVACQLPQPTPAPPAIVPSKSKTD